MVQYCPQKILTLVAIAYKYIYFIGDLQYIKAFTN
jgi:hypothetical protein